MREYLACTYFDEGEVSITYDRSRSGYYLVRLEREWFTNEEVLAVCKILLESRAFCKKELDTLVRKLLAQVTPNDCKLVEAVIGKKRFYYVPLQHGKKLLTAIWELSQYITKQEVLRMVYNRQDGTEREYASSHYVFGVLFLPDCLYD